MRQIHVVCVALLLFGCVELAHASPLIELTGGFGGMGGLQARHTGASAAASYFNPALLPRARTGLTVGFLLLNTNIGVRVDARSPENDVPLGLSDTFHADGTSVYTKPLGTDLLQNGREATPDGLTGYLAARPRQHDGSGHQTISYGGLGLVLKLFKERLAIGVYGLVPLEQLITMRSYYVDEREQYTSNSLHPEMYGDRLTALSFAFAAGVRLSDSFSFGIGVTLGLNANAVSPVYVASAARLDDLALNIDVTADIALTPHFGLAWDPGERWHLTGSLHAPQQIDVQASFSFLLATGNEQSSSLAFAYYSQPWQASAGLGYDFYVRSSQTWGVSGVLHYQRWSQYIDRQSVRPEGAYEWSDTLTGALGIRMKAGSVSLGLDGQYKPTPVPVQTGRTNYVDNDRLGSALSFEYAFTIAESELSIGAQLQLYRLIERRVRKIPPPTAGGVNRTPQLVWDEVPDDSLQDGRPVAGRDGLQTNNPGWPGYASLGWVSSGGIYLSVLL